MRHRAAGLLPTGPGRPPTRTARRYSRICPCVFPQAGCLATSPRYVRQRIPHRPAPAGGLGGRLIRARCRARSQHHPPAPRDADAATLTGTAGPARDAALFFVVLYPPAHGIIEGEQAITRRAE